MFENYFYKSIENHNYLNVFFLSLITTLLLAVVNYYIAGNAMFLVAFITLALSYPIIRYFKKLNNEEIKRIYPANKLFYNHIEEIITSWAVFLGVSIGFYIALISGLVTQLTYHQAFIGVLQGMLTAVDEIFMVILINNLTVGLFTFILSFLVFSGFIFVLVWNASLVAYYIFYTFEYSPLALLTVLLILPHGLLEIAGYVLAGIAGGILAYRLELFKNISKREQKEFRRDLSILIFGAILLITIGAIIEVL